MTVGERVKVLRKKLEMNQTEFGGNIGLKQTTIGLYENNQRNVPDRTVNDICREFDINEEWLRTGKGQMFKEQSIEEITYGRFGSIMEKGSPIKKNISAMLLAMIDTLPDEQWEYIYNEFKNCIKRTENEKGNGN